MSTRGDPSIREQDVDLVGNDEMPVAASSASSSSRPEPDEHGLLTIGWREWVSLPVLGIPAIKAKVDTGARTSALHALDIQRFTRNGNEDWVAFTVQPLQRDTTIERRCEAKLLDIRKVTDSGGHSKDRYFISTRLCIGSISREIEITLSERSDMLFRMLLGRTSMVRDMIVNPQLSYTVGRLNSRSLYSDDSTGTA